MADSLRQTSPFKHYVLTFFSCLLVLLICANDAFASPIAATPALARADEFSSLALSLTTPTPAPTALLLKRVAPVAVTNDGNITVLNPDTQQTIAQGSGSDGSGSDFSLPAILWLAFAFAVGAPLALAGIRLWRVTTGMGVGLAVALCVWAAFVNTVGADGLSDIVLTAIVLGSFAAGFVVGALDFGRWTGIILIGILGGFSVGVRVVLLRPGLLVPEYVANWGVLAVFMVLGLASILVRQRFGLVTCCAALGTFLIGLGVDLLLEKQSGISFALRFLLDRNNSHFLAIVHEGYNPTVKTQIILGASIGAIPVLAFAQHIIFKRPFRPETTTSDAELTSLMEAEPALGMPADKEASEEKPVRRSRMALLKSRFSMS